MKLVMVKNSFLKVLLAFVASLILDSAVAQESTKLHKTPLKSMSSISANADSLRKHVTELANITPPRSYAHPEGLLKASAYIQNVWKHQGWDVEIQNFNDGDRQFENVVVSYNAHLQDRVVVGAHYDVCGPFPGADDNASGIAGLLELTRMIKEQALDLPYGIDFVAYSTEEPPYFRSELMGSYVHAESLRKDSVKVKLMVVLEMIGYFSDEENSQSYPLSFLKWFYPTKANFIAFVGRTNELGTIRKLKRAYKKSTNIPVKSISTPFVFEGIDFSDHRNYWKMGYKAVMITDTSFFRNHHYHTAGDTPETLNYGKMVEVVNGLFNAMPSL